MSILAIAWRYLVGRRVAALLTAATVALGVGLIVATALLTRGLREGFIEGTTDYSLVVGAKGSPTQLVLNVVFRMDTATPNISMANYDDVRGDPLVDVAVPIAMGDAYQGFRYVATMTGYFADYPWRRRRFTVADGRLFADDTAERPSYEAVLGAQAARRTGLRIGDRFFEGEEGAEYPLAVVGVLHPTATADDRAIFVSLSSYWEMNEISRRMGIKPLTAVLVRAKRMADLPALHRRLNVAADTQAVFPSAVLLSIFNVLALVEDVLSAVLGMVAALVLSYVFLSMYGAARERRREIATMRAMGARRATVLTAVLLESCLLAAVGGAVGIAGGHAAAYLGARLLAARAGPVAYHLEIGAREPLVLAAVLALGAVAGLLPALMAYRTEVAENLAPLS